MPFSQSSQISSIVGWVEVLQPESILDVGTGMGQYGFLFRNALEQENLFQVEGRQASQRDKAGWRVRIDGVEAFSTYLTPVHDYAYNRILVGDAQALLPTIADNSYDLVVAIDVLEHLDDEPGARFLAELRRISRRAVLISTPKTFHAQEIEANPYENHRSVWSYDQLAAAGFREMLPNSESWIVASRK